MSSGYNNDQHERKFRISNAVRVASLCLLLILGCHTNASSTELTTITFAPASGYSSDNHTTTTKETTESCIPYSQLEHMPYGNVKIQNSESKILGIPYDRTSRMRAIELSTTDIFQLNFAFKAGKRYLYVFPAISYDVREDDRIACGFGLGSNLDFSQRCFVNTELLGQMTISQGYDHYRSLKVGLGYKLSNQLEVKLGPTLMWHVQINEDDYNDNYQEFDKDMVQVNELKLGWNVSVYVNL